MYLSMVYGKFLLQQVVLNVKMSSDISRHPMCYGLAFTVCTLSAAFRICFNHLLSIFSFVFTLVGMLHTARLLSCLTNIKISVFRASGF